MRRPRGGLASRPILCLLLVFFLTSFLAGHVAAQRDDPSDRPDTDRPEPTREVTQTNSPTRPDRTQTPPPSPPPTDRETATARTPTPQPTETESRNLPGLSTESSTPTTTQDSTSSRSSSGPAFTLPSLTGGPTIPTQQITPKRGASVPAEVLPA
ncbi:hypothetical protein CISG_10312 [Coccidioides immitis RMSCC 3703]|uniref:Uncharacterized protein n=1 Tax=Coccidioides immitis RMSCC 3703 TaxID=454286 RepID=A0A0J8QP08_COCIT|nr:hypothetical protein CISG_10312 [Coccidioides immitis RMSCC 3703]